MTPPYLSFPTESWRSGIQAYLNLYSLFFRQLADSLFAVWHTTYPLNPYHLLALLSDPWNWEVFGHFFDLGFYLGQFGIVGDIFGNNIE